MFSLGLFPDGDNGGNRIRTRQAGNLHSLWDRFPGRRANFRTARNKAIAHSEDMALAALGREAAAVLDEREWLDESHYLAAVVVYDAEVMVPLRLMEAGEIDMDPIDLSGEYLQTGGRISTQRVVQAGYRLGAVLKQIVAE